MKVIAEVGSNFKGIEDCVKSIYAAADAKADVVKFQYFNSYDLYGEVFDMRGTLPAEWLPELCTHASEAQIEFMCTAFSPSGYDLINKYVKRHKIASAELPAVDILEAVNSFKKPVILSTGGATLPEISDALAILKDCEVTILYCVADYPAKVIDLRNIPRLKLEFPKNDIGFSDHSLDVCNIPLLAKQQGAQVIEKHVNFTDLTDTPDAPHSINGRELALMVRILKGDRLTLEDTGALCNQKMRNEWRRRPVINQSGETRYYRPRP